jgi:hypothetical protein
MLAHSPLLRFSLHPPDARYRSWCGTPSARSNACWNGALP